MAMFLQMDKIKKTRVLVDKRYFRTHALSRNALSHVMADAETSRLQFQGGTATQEAVVNASWLLLDAMGPDWVAKHLRPILALMEGFPAEDDPDFLDRLAEASAKVAEWKATLRPEPTGERFVRAAVIPIKGEADAKGPKGTKGKGGVKGPKGTKGK